MIRGSRSELSQTAFWDLETAIRAARTAATAERRNPLSWATEGTIRGTDCRELLISGS